MSDLISRQDAVEGAKELFACADIGNDECDITYMLENPPSADRPKNMIHIDEVYRLIAGHSNYHGDSILAAFTCLVEGKDVKPIAPLDESADRPTGEWIDADGNKVRLDADGHPLDSCWCSNCGEWLVASDEHKVLGKFCPNCGKRMYKGGDTE